LAGHWPNAQVSLPGHVCVLLLHNLNDLSLPTGQLLTEVKVMVTHQ